MRVKDIDISVTMKIPVDIPDENDVVYTREAIEKAVISAGQKQLPIVFNDDTEHDDSVVGYVRNMRIDRVSEDKKYAFVTMNGKIFFGGIECFVDECLVENIPIHKESSSYKVTDFRFSAIGISV